MDDEKFLFVNYIRNSGYVNAGLVKIRRNDGSIYYYDGGGWRPASVDGVGALLRWMGTVPTYSALPLNPRRGDVWTVLDQDGAEFAWDGSNWEFLGRATAGTDIKWDVTKTYQNGEICYYNFEIYFSIVDNNQAQQPDNTVGVSWKKYSSSAAVTWNDITGKPTFSTVATSGSYLDLTNRPNLSTVATSGSYLDLTNTPSPYVLPRASTSVLGGVKVDGSTVTIDGNGVISAAGGGGSVSALTQDTTVPIAAPATTETAAETTARIQGLIDAQPKNLNGHTLTFQFADGTYIIDNTLMWKDFCGGLVVIRGNDQSESLVSIVNGKSLPLSSGNLIELQNLSNVQVLRLTVTVESSGVGPNGGALLQADRCNIYMGNCSFDGKCSGGVYPARNCITLNMCQAGLWDVSVANSYHGLQAGDGTVVMVVRLGINNTVYCIGVNGSIACVALTSLTQTHAGDGGQIFTNV